MSYKVQYHTLAKFEDGRVGNIRQSTDHIFTDNKIEDIPKALNEYLGHKQRVGVIDKIEDVGGVCV